MRPQTGDFHPYYKGYIDLVEGEDILYILNEQSKETQQLLDSFSLKKGNYTYAEGKWTVKEIIGHLIDSDRVFAFRALSIARGEKKSLPGFDQNEYVRLANFHNRDLFDLTYEFRLLRESNLLFFRGLDESNWQNRGVANNSEITVLAIMFIIAGHQKHHCKILKEKYSG